MLVRDTDILIKYAQITAGTRYDSLEASLRMVELKYIKPVLGYVLYDLLNDAIDDDPTEANLLPEFADLLHQCRMAIGPLFCFFHADKADVLFSDSGMQRTETQTNKNAYQEQREKFKEKNREEGEEAMEMLQAHLELNQEDFPEWTDSDEFKKYKSLFIKSGSQFNEFFPSHTPHRNYRAMRSKMYDVEENAIRNFLGDELFDALKTEDEKKDPVFEEEQTELLKKLKRAIANLTVAAAAPLLNVRISSNGLTVPATASFSQDDASNTRAGIDHKMVDTFIISCSAAGTQWLDNAEKYLRAHPDEFAGWIGFATAEETDDNNVNDKDLTGTFSM